MRSVTAITALSLLTLVTALRAEDVPLYDAPPPEDAAFVRFLGTTGDSVTWQGLDFAAGDNVLSDYFIVHAPQVGRTPGEMLSILPGDVVIVAPPMDVAKVMLGLVNMGDAPASLLTADGTVAIIADVAPGSAGWREVNPVAVDVQVMSEGAALGAPMSLALRRGEPQTLVLGADGAVEAVISAFVPGVVE